MTTGRGQSVAAALTAALTAGKPEPVTIEEVLGTYAGGNPALARELAGLPSTGALPRKGTAERRRYDTAMRRVQRYGSTGAERRRPKGEALADLRRRGLVNLAGPQLAKARREGLAVRFMAHFRVSRNFYTKAIPPARGDMIYLTPDEAPDLMTAVRGALALWRAGDREAAGADIESLAWAHYWNPDDESAEEIIGELIGISDAWVRI
jgi:hypothetical protein